MKQVIKDRFAKAAIYISAAFTVIILAVIIGFIVIKGLPGINLNFLTRDFEDNTTYVTTALYASASENVDDGYISQLGITLGYDDEGLYIKNIDRQSVVRDAKNTKNEPYALKKKDYITSVGDVKLATYASATDAYHAFDEAICAQSGSARFKIVRPGGGIVPMVVTTLMMIGVSLLIAAPIGIITAIYLNEYGKQGKLLALIHFAIENLAGIPSIIYGLFGSVFFVTVCKMQYSLLAGAMTVSIILLPTIITTTEETLKTVPDKYRESSLGLGATKLQTVYKVVLPNAIPGILVAIILSIGRIVGESAALLLTAGTVAQIPKALTGNSASGATLTIKAYTLMKEENDLTTACAIGIVLLALIIVLNCVSKAITNRFMKKKGA